MKRIVSPLLAFGTAAVFLTACNSTPASSATMPASVPASLASSSVGVSPSSNTLVTEEKTAQILTAIEPSAGLGATLPLTLLDLTASGDVLAEEVVTASGLQSNLYQQNGGIIYVVQAQPGKADDVKAGLTKMKDALLSQGENYKTEFPEAYANIENAVIATEGDFVVYATCASGDAATLADAVTAALKA